MVKKVLFFALGGHIATQNASFRKLIEVLEPKGYEFYGAKNGFSCFDTGEVYRLKVDSIPKDFAGFVAGAGRSSLTKKGIVDEEKIERAKRFFKTGGFDIAVGSGGDDHGKQMAILEASLEGKLGVYVLNKTMDNDLGGQDGFNGAPYTDFTNGFHTAVVRGVEIIKQHFAGAWTNNVPYLIGHFGREANWVGAALAYWGNADKIIYGELSEDHEGHSLETVHNLIEEAQDKNESLYGRRFAMIIVPEGTRISGIQGSSDLVDAHGHHKLQPEVLVSNLKDALEKKYKMKSQSTGITYEMRNFTPTEIDIVLAEGSAEVLAKAIEKGNSGVESTFKLEDCTTIVGLEKISLVSEKRLASYYPQQLINPETFEVTDEIGKYYSHLFGSKEPLGSWLPPKMESACVFAI
jgi:6-phosphofructokinase